MVKKITILYNSLCKIPASWGTQLFTATGQQLRLSLIVLGTTCVVPVGYPLHPAAPQPGCYYGANTQHTSNFLNPFYCSFQRLQNYLGTCS